MGGSAVRRAAEAHVEKVRSLGEILPKLVKRLGLMGWSQALTIPAAVSLTAPDTKIHFGVPIIPITELPSFLGEFEAHLDSLTHFKLRLPNMGRGPIQTILRPEV